MELFIHEGIWNRGGPLYDCRGRPEDLPQMDVDILIAVSKYKNCTLYIWIHLLALTTNTDLLGQAIIFGSFNR